MKIFICEGTKMKLGSVCRAGRAQSNGPAMRSLANFHIELEQFCCATKYVLKDALGDTENMYVLLCSNSGLHTRQHTKYASQHIYRIRNLEHAQFGLSNWLFHWRVCHEILRRLSFAENSQTHTSS